MKLRLDTHSQLTLTAPPETFGPSFPAGERQTRPVLDLEEMAIPVGEERVVEVDVRSPWFRNELLGGFADLTISGVIRVGIGLLLTALIALFNDELKAILKRAIKRVRSRPASPD
jgi:hypothetical protein